MAMMGVKSSNFVVTYDTSANNFYGFRCAWVLQAMGHSNSSVKVLDGGFA